MRLIWLTDVHLNFIPHGASKTFGEYVLAEETQLGGPFDAVVVTGDIAEYTSFEELIEEFAQGVGKPVYFVLGNHDAYGGSIRGMRAKAEKMKGKARWLVSEQSVQLCEGTVLVGQDGWYDARFGDAKRSQVTLNDFMVIKELMPLRGAALFLALQGFADVFAAEARALLEAAIEAGNTRVVFATHVPPFWQATWHEGKQSDKHWLPWMSSKAMGDMLNELSASHPDVEFLVLCGHTHGAGTYQHAPNLKVLTGHSAYRLPRVSDRFEFSAG